MCDIPVNLAYLHSISGPAKTFQQSMGAQIHTIKLAALFAEIITFDTSQPEDKEDSSHPVSKLTSTSSNCLISLRKIPRFTAILPTRRTMTPNEYGKGSSVTIAREKDMRLMDVSRSVGEMNRWRKRMQISLIICLAAV
jgi:hypothetical protein